MKEKYRLKKKKTPFKKSQASGTSIPDQCAVCGAAIKSDQKLGKAFGKKFSTVIHRKCEQFAKFKGLSL